MECTLISSTEKENNDQLTKHELVKAQLSQAKTSCSKFYWSSNIWATPWQNLFIPYANNKDTDQNAYPSSLFSTFVVRYLDGRIPIVTSLCYWPPKTGWPESWLFIWRFRQTLKSRVMRKPVFGGFQPDGIRTSLLLRGLLCYRS